MTPSGKRQKELAADAPIARVLYEAACERFGKAAVGTNFSLVWNLRCMWGMNNRLPFEKGTVSKNWGELHWVLKSLCDL